jgi:heme/copper-type cytochrome/quinol oxidase subunit 3
MSPAGRRVLDVNDLPDYAFGPRGLIWWGTVGYMVIEGSVFAMLFASYFFLRFRANQWPPSPYPDLTLGTVNLVIMLVSVVPNHLAKSAAEHFHLGRVRLWMVVSILFEVAFLVVRWFEQWRLGTNWDTNAYGSIVWVTLGTHTSHVVTDLADTVVVAALMFTRHTEPRRFVDVSENSRYWYFVIVTWVLVYLLIYWAPRWL